MKTSRFKSYHSLLLYLFIFSFFPTALRAQNEINVNNATGVMSVNIPLHTLTLPGLNLGIGLSYAAKGYKITEGYKPYNGWNLYGGGNITRVLRGLPDDKIANEWNSDPREGWLNGGNRARPLTLNPSDIDCTGDQTNNDWLNSNFNFNRDLEPDIFIVNAPGLNFKFVFDNQNGFKTIPAQSGVAINFTRPDHRSSSFVITTQAGIKYTFDVISKWDRMASTAANNLDLFQTDQNYFKPNYYASGLQSMDMWHLSRIDFPLTNNNAWVTYQYTSLSVEPKEQVKFYVKDNVLDKTNEFQLYEWKRSFNVQVMTSLTTSYGTKVQFGDNPANNPSVIYVYNSLEPNRPPDKTIHFNSIDYSNNSAREKGFLKSITQTLRGGCQTTLYKFTYYGVVSASVTPQFPTGGDISGRTDAWGYYNGGNGETKVPKIYVYPALKNATGIYRPYQIPNYAGEMYVLPGADLTANENTLPLGSLSSITYPMGGSSSFEYESNTFWDQDGNAAVKGGGLRIKAIRHFDGMNLSTVMKKEFNYNDAQGKTSGVINLMPYYAITTPYYKDPVTNTSRTYSNILSSYGQSSLAFWNYLTVRTAFDMTNNASSVSYSRVTVSEDGKGSIRQLFSIPASFWDMNPNAFTYVAESCNANNNTFVTRSYNAYPFVPAETWKGNDLLEEQTLDNNNNLLKKVELSYENYLPATEKVYGVTVDNNYGIRQINKYAIEVNASLLKQKKETVYNSDLSGNGILTVTDFDNSATGRKLRSVTLTNPDNSQIKNSYYYVLDLAPMTDLPAGNDAWEGINLLLRRGMYDVLVEESKAYKPANGTQFKTVTASVSFYGKHSTTYPNIPVIKEVRNFRNVEGVLDFQSIRVNRSSTYSIEIDPRYVVEKTISDYDKNNIPRMIVQNRMITSMVNDIGVSLPTMKIAGVGLNEFAYSNFDNIDYSLDGIFKTSLGDEYYSKDPYWGKALKISSYAISAKVTPRANEKKYKVAFLAKADQAGKVYVKVHTTQVAVINIPVSTEFKYYEQIIDLSTVPAAPATFFVSVSANDNEYPKIVTIDNLIFFPADAQYVSHNYHHLVGRTSELQSTGMASLFEYDSTGRYIATRNLAKDIRSTRLYASVKEMTSSDLNPGFTMLNPNLNYAQRPLKFSAGNSCAVGVKYTWTFGDGSPALVTYDNTVSHTFVGGGNYNITLKVQHPDYPERTYSNTTTIQAAPEMHCEICVSGIVKKNYTTGEIDYADCPGMPPGWQDSPEGTKFYMKTWGCNNSYTFQWEVSTDGGVVWNQYRSSYPGNYETDLEITDLDLPISYHLRCRIYAAACDIEFFSTPIFIQKFF